MPSFDSSTLFSAPPVRLIILHICEYIGSLSKGFMPLLRTWSQTAESRTVPYGKSVCLAKSCKDLQGNNQTSSNQKLFRNSIIGLMPGGIIIERLQHYLQNLQCECMNTHTFELNCANASVYKSIQQLRCTDAHPFMLCRILFIQQFVLISYI